MRPNNNQRRGRGRAGRRPNIPARAQTYDSNGPGGRIRGNATQVYEKYAALARDAMAAGDRVLAEGLHQYAEHYYRIINDSTDPEPLRPPAPPREEAEAAQDAPREATEGSEAGSSTSDTPAPASPAAGGQAEPPAAPRRSRRRPRASAGDGAGMEEAQPRHAERPKAVGDGAADAESLPAEDEGLRKMLSATASPQAEENSSRRRKTNGAAQASEGEAEKAVADEQPEATTESV